MRKRKKGDTDPKVILYSNQIILISHLGAVSAHHQQQVS